MSINLIPVPNTVPMSQDIETYNSTSIVVVWEPVPDNREFIKGRVAGYRVCILSSRC